MIQNEGISDGGNGADSAVHRLQIMIGYREIFYTGLSNGRRSVAVARPYGREKMSHFVTPRPSLYPP